MMVVATRCSTKLIDKKFTKILQIGFLVLLLNSIYYYPIFAQNLIFGYASSYKNDTLRLFYYEDFITNKKKYIAYSKVQPNGLFNFNFTIDTLREIFIDLEKLYCSVIIRPHDTLEIRIPRKITSANQPNFDKNIVPAFVVNEDTNGLNYLTNKINQIINENRDLLIFVADTRKKHEILQKSIEQINNITPTQDTIFVENYKKYAIGYLRAIYEQKISISFIKNYFANTQSYIYVPTFVALFNLCFDNFFDPKNDKIEFSKIFLALKENNFDTIINYLTQSQLEFSPQMAYLVALKGLFDLYYSEIPKQLQQDIIKTIQKLNITNHNQYKVTINNIIDYFTYLKTGFNIENFILLNAQNQQVSLQEFSNNFVYLNFVDLTTKAGIQYFEMLRKYTQQNITMLKIVTIAVCDDFQTFKNFVNRNKNYNWTFLWAKPHSPIIDYFRIEIYPAFFLIDPNRQIATDHCPTPAENFEQIYNTAYKKWKENPNPQPQKTYYEDN